MIVNSLLCYYTDGLGNTFADPTHKYLIQVHASKIILIPPHLIIISTERSSNAPLL